MNPWQMALQIREELRTVVWPDGSGEKVFGAKGALLVVGGTLTDAQIMPRFPFALVSIESGRPDPEEPALIEQDFTVVIAQQVQGDPMGEHAVAGGATSSLLHSAGRGTGEIAARVRAAVQDLTGINGAKILLSATRTGGGNPLGPNNHLALDELGLTALCTSDLHYAAPQEISRSGNVFAWLGPHCSDRFDFLEYTLVLNTNNIPTDSTDGATIYTGTPATHTIGGPPLSGDFYAAFAHYKRLGSSTAAGESDPVVGSHLQV